MFFMLTPTTVGRIGFMISFINFALKCTQNMFVTSVIGFKFFDCLFNFGAGSYINLLRKNSNS